MSGIFITGTDTGVGKTLICGYLAGFLRQQGVRVITQKWVQTGCTELAEDVLLHQTLSGLSDDPALTSLRNPYCFALPASPHLAAACEGMTIDPAVIGESYRQLETRYDLVLVEGAGGILVPLAERLLTADLVAQIGLPALLVAPNRLGCINHTLLTIEAMRQRRIPILGIIFTRLTADGDERMLQENIRIISTVAGVPVFGELPFLPDPLAGAIHFAPIGRAIITEAHRYSLFEPQRHEDTKS